MNGLLDLLPEFGHHGAIGIIGQMFPEISMEVAREVQGHGWNADNLTHNNTPVKILSEFLALVHWSRGDRS
jgi:hypothetical protein